MKSIRIFPRLEAEKVAFFRRRAQAPFSFSSLHVTNNYLIMCKGSSFKARIGQTQSLPDWTSASSGSELWKSGPPLTLLPFLVRATRSMNRNESID